MSGTPCSIAASAKCMVSTSLHLVEKGILIVPQRVSRLAPITVGARRNLRPGFSGSRAPLQPRLGRDGKKKLAGTVFQRALEQVSPEIADERTELPLAEHTPGPLDELFLKVFREKMVQEVGWESQKPGYDGLLEVVKHLYTNSSKPETEKATVRIFTALFPSWIVLSFRHIILPIASGKVAAVLMAFATKATTEWLMGPSMVNQVTLADGSTLPSGVLVQRCKFLEGTKCAGICTHMCKIPTQAFFKNVMGVPLAMEPNFTDFSCQFNIGVEALPRDQDPGLQTPCLSICPTANARLTVRHVQTVQCPQVHEPRLSKFATLPAVDALACSPKC